MFISQIVSDFSRRLICELGVHSIYQSPIDTKLICLQRFVRLFAYGASTLVLVLYLAALGVSEFRIGLFMTLTLVGDVLISLCLTLVADALGRKMILALGALLMTGSGIVFALSSDYVVLLAASILGVISPSGNEIGPFRAIEESTLAFLTPAANRSDVYAWYSLIGTAGTALGIISCGWIVHTLQLTRQWSSLRAYRTIFVLYAATGVIKLFLVCAMSKKIELEKAIPDVISETADSEVAPLLPNEDPAAAKKPKKSVLSFASVARYESKMIVLKLCVLFLLDSFASGLAPLSWVTYFFRTKFDLQEGSLGSLFFFTSIIASASMLVASSISKRIGNVKTMVFTHLPSAFALALIPIPSSLPLAMMFLILRSCTQSMDVAPRSAFLAAVILPHERTAVMGTINVVKTISQSIGPLITGMLATKGLFWVAFVAAGTLKATYDLGMLILFANYENKIPQVSEEQSNADQGASDDGQDSNSQ